MQRVEQNKTIGGLVFTDGIFDDAGLFESLTKLLPLAFSLDNIISTNRGQQKCPSIFYKRMIGRI